LRQALRKRIGAGNARHYGQGRSAATDMVQRVPALGRRGSRRTGRALRRRSSRQRLGRSPCLLAMRQPRDWFCCGAETHRWL